MIELRHTESKAAAHAGAPAPFLMHAVGAATDDAARGKIDDVLRRVEVAGRPADIGRAAPSFREGQPDAADALAPGDVGRVRAARNALDPDRTFVFQRHLESARGADAPPGAV
jgi:hypothetical protein